MVMGLLCWQALFAQKFQVQTNAVAWMSLGTINARMEYGVDRYWSVGVGGKFNPFVFPKDGGQDQMQLKQRSAALYARWWPWHVYSGWWLSGQIQWQEYNMGGIISPRTEEGQRYGGGLSAGYCYMISPHLNLDMGLGFWGGIKDYVVYECPKCGKRVASGIKSFVMPTDVMLSISYVF